MTMPSGEAGLDEGFDQWGVANGGVSAFAGRTQGTVTSFYQGQVGGNNVLLDVIDGFWNGILSGFENLGSLLEQIIAAITGALGGTFTTLSDFISGMVDGIGDALSGLASLIDDLWNNVGSVIQSIPQALVSGLTSAMNALNSFIQGVLDGIITAIRGIPFVGGAIADLLAALTGYREVTDSNAVNQQNFTISAISQFYRNPTWMSRYPLADVTYPEAFNTVLRADGVTEGASAGTAHTHAISTSNVLAGPAYWDLDQNHSRGGYITTSATTVYDTVGVVVMKAAGTLNNVYLEIFREDSSGGLVRVYVSADISVSVGISGSYVELSIPPMIAQAGERHMVRLRNSSSVATMTRIVGVEQMAFAVDASLRTTNSTQTNQTSYSAADAATYRSAGTVLPWVMLAAKNLPESDVSYSDDFNRANLGPWWVTSGAGDITISGSRATYGGTTNGDQHSLYIRRTTGDASMVSGNLHVDGAATTQRFGLRLHCDREETQFVYLGITGTDAKIYSYTASTLTQRATVAMGGTDFYSLYYDEPNDKYVALKNNEPFGLEWAGVGSAIIHGEQYRFSGARITRASGVNAGAIDNWTLRDWKP